MKKQTKKKTEAPTEPGLLDLGFFSADDLGLTGMSLFITRPTPEPPSPPEQETPEDSSNSSME